jgi:hypothetical protein
LRCLRESTQSRRTLSKGEKSLANKGAPGVDGITFE